MPAESTKAGLQVDLLRPLPDVVLPSQFFESVGSRAFSTEQRLMLAVLADAINIFCDYRGSPNPRKRQSFNEVSSWVFADGIEGPMSFDRVCDALGMNAEDLRRRLSELASGRGASNLLRLRLKAGGRMQRVTARRVRRRAVRGS